jgi:hypothetical protein
MATELQSIDITDSTELLDLAEEVHQTGVGRLLRRGDEELAALVPVTPRRTTRTGHKDAHVERDTILDIVGIGASAEPTDIAQHEQEYLAEAYTPSRH